MNSAEDLIAEGYAARKGGDLADGLRRYTAAVDALRGMDEPLRLAHTVRHVADIQSELGELNAAQANYAEALAIYRAEPATGKLDLANTLRGYGLLMEKLGDNAAAAAMWAQAGRLYAAVGVQAGVDEAGRRLVEGTSSTRIPRIGIGDLGNDEHNPRKSRRDDRPRRPARDPQ